MMKKLGKKLMKKPAAAMKKTKKRSACIKRPAMTSSAAVRKRRSREKVLMKKEQKKKNNVLAKARRAASNGKKYQTKSPNLVTWQLLRMLLKWKPTALVKQLMRRRKMQLMHAPLALKIASESLSWRGKLSQGRKH